MDLHEHFTIHAKNARFAKKKGWGGEIRLFRLDTRTLHTGHLPELREWAAQNGFTLEADFDADPNQITPEAIRSEFDYLLFEPHDFQLAATAHCVNSRRALIVSPTRSGKTLISYMLAKILPAPTLIIVPTTSLVLQMSKDFVNYGGPERGDLQMIKGDKRAKGPVSKDVVKDIVVSTQASIRDQPPEWFNQFGCIIADEVHEYDARTLRGIIEKATDVPYVFGMTGSLKDSKTSVKTLTGLFGPEFKTATSKELMERGIISNLTIKTVVLDYSEEDRQAAHGLAYHDEMKFIIGHEKRNRILVELAKELKENVLMMFFYIDDHGKVLYDLAVNLASEKQVHYVDGSVDAEDREKIRAAFERDNLNLGITSFGTFSTGITISNLVHIILCSPSKARVRILQTIGRALGLHEDKIKAIVWDFVDDLRHNGDTNYTLKHFEERLVIFYQEGFDVEIHHVKVG
jgi:superfamily II DNA or RNA helicase